MGVAMARGRRERDDDAAVDGAHHQHAGQLCGGRGASWVIDGLIGGLRRRAADRSTQLLLRSSFMDRPIDDPPPPAPQQEEEVLPEGEGDEDDPNSVEAVKKGILAYMETRRAVSVFLYIDYCRLGLGCFFLGGGGRGGVDWSFKPGWITHAA